MKKIYSLLLLSGLMLLGAQSVMADNITKGGTLYIRNIKAASLGGAVWTSTDGYMRAVVRGGEGNSDTWITPTLVYGTNRAEGAVYAFTIPTVTNAWTTIFITRGDKADHTWADGDGMWNQTYGITLSTTQNLICSYDVNSTSANWTDYDARTTATNWYLNSSNSSWTSVQFMKATAEATTATVTLENLEAWTEYEFYVQSAASGVTLKNSGTMVANNCTGWTLTDNANNPKFKTTIAGNYQFTFSLNDNKLSLAYPTAYERAVNSGAWGTVCFPVDAELSSTYVAHVYSINYKDGEHLYLTEEANLSLRGGRPYIFKAKSGVSKITATLSSAGTNYEPVEWYWRGLYGEYGRTPFTNWGVDNIYIVTDTEIRKATQKSGVLPNRAYIAINMVPDEAETSAPGLPIIAMPLEPNNATNINSIEASEKAVKFFENGQLFIQKNGVVYDMTGRVVR